MNEPQRFPRTPATTRTFFPLRRIEGLFSSFSPLERLIAVVLGTTVTLSALLVVRNLNEHLLVEIPERGGSFSEGLVGTPRFINPLLSYSDADRDLTALIYSGLLRARGDGTLIPDLAESYAVSEDGLSYAFTLREGAIFHDGTRITPDDVIFTITKALDPTLKSPRRASFEGIRIEKTGEREVTFFLKQPYAPFLENMTMGVLPKHLWERLAADAFPFSEYNIRPVGSGPYKVRSVTRDSSGVPSSYELSAFPSFTLGEPNVTNLSLRVYQSEDELIAALRKGEVEGAAALSPERLGEIGEGYAIDRYPLPRIFGVFFNQNQATVLTHQEVRVALDVAAPKENIVRDVLMGYGVAIDSPLPSHILATRSGTSTYEKRGIEAARAILERNGWKKNAESGVYEKTKGKVVERIAFSLATGNTPELRGSAEALKVAWEEMGAEVEVKYFEAGDLNQNVIRPRKYDALLFGEIVGRELDLFAFWHSSQRNDPGLNIALYANSDADRHLSRSRTLTDFHERAEELRAFEQELKRDTPAVFLFSPDFLYVRTPKLRGFTLGLVTIPADRFSSVYEWYVHTERVWSFLTPFIK